MIKATIEKDTNQYKFGEDIMPIFGGDTESPRWVKYLNGWKREFRPYIIAIKNAVIDNGLIGVTADNFCNDHLFEFSDGSKPVSFSWRAWGDLMSAIVGKKEGYMRYYM